MSIQTGSTVTVRRGKHSNRTGTVTHTGGGKSVVGFEDDDFETFQDTNLRTPERHVVSLTQLAEAIRETTQQYTDAGPTITTLASRLDHLSEAERQELTDAIQWPTAIGS